LNKIKLIYGLTAIVITLIVFSVGIDVTEKFSDEKLPYEYSIKEIENLFFTELYNFGMQQEWVTKKKIWKNIPDSIKYYYKIKTPVELTIPEIILLFKQKFSKYKNIKVKNNEFRINSTSQLQIFSGNKLKFRVQFDYDNKIKRIRSNISFVVDKLENVSEENKKKLLEISYPCALMLTPSPITRKIVESLPAFDKDYVIIINDYTSGKLYELDPSYSKRKIKRSIANIVNDFSSSVKFFVDQNSDIFNSVMFNYIKDEFKRKRVILYKLSTLKNVSKKSEAEKLSFLQYHFNDVETKGKKVFYITADDYLKLQNYIEVYKKKGNRFVPLSKD